MSGLTRNDDEVLGPEALGARDFSLEGFKGLVGEDPRALLEMATLALRHYETCGQDFQRALEAGDLAGFEFHAHKLKMTMTLLGAHGLRAVLQQCRSLLTAPARDAAQVRAVLHALHGELDAIIDFLRREVRRFEQPESVGGA